MIYGIKIDTNNTAFVKEYEEYEVKAALSECRSVSSNTTDAFTIADALNERLSGNKSYMIHIGCNEH